MANRKVSNEEVRKKNYSLSVEQGEMDKMDKIIEMRWKHGKCRSTVVNKLIKKYNLKHGV